MRREWHVALFASALALSWCPPLEAEEPAQVASASEEARVRSRELFRRGTELSREGKWHEALAEYQAAYAAFPHPSISFNIGTCYAQVGQRAEAWLAVDRTVTSGSAPPNALSAELLGEAVELQRRLERELGRVVLHLHEPASVGVDGKNLERGSGERWVPSAEATASPQREGRLLLLLDPGAHAISVIDRGQAVQLRVLVQPGQQIELESPQPAVQSPSPSAAGAAPTSDRAKPLEKQPRTRAQEPAPSSTPRTNHEPAWLAPSRYAAWSLTAAGAVTTLVAGTLMLRETSNLNDACADPGRCDESERSSVDRYHRSATWTNVGLGVLAAGAVATLSLYVFVDDEGGSPGRSVATLRMAPGTLELSGRF